MTNKERTQIQNDIVSTIEVPHGRLLLAPRVGKSRIAIQTIKKFKPQSILWVTPSAKLAKDDIPKEFEKWNAKRYLKRLQTTTYASLHKVVGYFDLVILDEEQHLTELNSQWLTQNKHYGTILSMTGTPTKHRTKLELYKKLNLGVIYTMKINEAVDLGILSSYDTTVLMIPLEKEKAKKYVSIQRCIDGHKVGNFEFQEDRVMFSGKFNGTLGLSSRESKHGGELFALISKDESTVGYYVIKEDGTHTGKIKVDNNEYRLSDGIVHTPYAKSLLINRKQAIGNSQLKEDVAKHLLDKFKGQRKIIFCNSIEQANLLSPDSQFHSKTSRLDLDAFLDGCIDTIAMVNSGGTGFTYKKLEHLIIVQTDSDRNGSTSQKICRTLLSQKNYAAKIWILCIEGTQDEVWTKLTLENFDPSKVTYKSFNHEERKEN